VGTATNKHHKPAVKSRKALVLGHNPRSFCSFLVHTAGVQCAMPQLSESEQAWTERARELNYRCRGCREYIAFADQELYFARGLCTPCFDVIVAEAGHSSNSKKRLEEFRLRGGHEA
jgi:hypothetical protein